LIGGGDIDNGILYIDMEKGKTGDDKEKAKTGDEDIMKKKNASRTYASWFVGWSDTTWYR